MLKITLALIHLCHARLVVLNFTMAVSKNFVIILFIFLITEVREYSADVTEKCSNADAGSCMNNTYYGNLLIFSTSSRVKVLNLTTNELIVIKNKTECSTLTAAHDFVYYTKYRDDSKRIYKASIRTNETGIVLIWNVAITSVAIDYITGNIYFSTETSVVVCSREDRKSCRHIVCYDASYMALAPKSGMMFYARKAARGHRKYILKANMDGTDEDVVVDGTFKDPISLTVDEYTETLYWMEKGANKIHFIPYNKNNARITSIEIEKINSTAGITVYGRKILVALSQGYVISELDTSSQDLGMFYPDVSTLSIQLVHAYNPIVQGIQKTTNPCNKTVCDQDDICLLHPIAASKELKTSCLNIIQQTEVTACG